MQKRHIIKTFSVLTDFVGSLLGDFEGDTLGLTDGDILGLVEGDCDGLGVGFVLGDSVVGVMTGLLEGESVVGALLGARDGDRLGLDVGYKMNDVKERVESEFVIEKKKANTRYPFGYPFLFDNKQEN